MQSFVNNKYLFHFSFEKITSFMQEMGMPKRLYAKRSCDFNGRSHTKCHWYKTAKNMKLFSFLEFHYYIYTHNHYSLPSNRGSLRPQTICGSFPNLGHRISSRNWYVMTDKQAGVAFTYRSRSPGLGRPQNPFVKYMNLKPE